MGEKLFLNAHHIFVLLKTVRVSGTLFFLILTCQIRVALVVVRMGGCPPEISAHEISACHLPVALCGGAIGVMMPLCCGTKPWLLRDS